MDSRTVTLTIDSLLENIALLGVATRAIARECGLAEADAQRVELCVVEIASNCIRHAYGGEAGHSVTVRLTALPRQLEVAVVDEGAPIPAERRSPRPIEVDPRNVQSIPETGRGLFLVHQLMDTVAYRREGSHNVVVMTKALP